MNLNKTWLYLILIGLVFLIAFVIWEITQLQTNLRTNLNVTEYSRDILLNQKTKDHLKSDPEFANASVPSTLDQITPTPSI